MLQVRTKGSNVAWSTTSVRYFYSRKDVLKYIETEISKTNFEYYEYRPMRYIPVDLR